MDNDSDTSRFIDLGFIPVPLAQGPDTVLAFTVIGPGGELVPFGSRIDLTGPLFSYAFTKLGTYRIRAQLTFTARAWPEKYAQAEGKSLSKEFRSLLASRSLFCEGSAESNEIIIEVR